MARDRFLDSTPYVGWVSCWFFSALRGFSLGTRVFASPQKLALPNSNSIQISVNELPLCGGATGNSYYYYYYYCFPLLLHLSFSWARNIDVNLSIFWLQYTQCYYVAFFNSFGYYCSQYAGANPKFWRLGLVIAWCATLRHGTLFLATIEADWFGQITNSCSWLCTLCTLMQMQIQDVERRGGFFISAAVAVALLRQIIYLLLWAVYLKTTGCPG